MGIALKDLLKDIDKVQVGEVITLENKGKVDYGIVIKGEEAYTIEVLVDDFRKPIRISRNLVIERLGENKANLDPKVLHYLEIGRELDELLNYVEQADMDNKYTIRKEVIRTMYEASVRYINYKNSRREGLKFSDEVISKELEGVEVDSPINWEHRVIKGSLYAYGRKVLAKEELTGNHLKILTHDYNTGLQISDYVKAEEVFKKYCTLKDNLGNLRAGKFRRGRYKTNDSNQLLEEYIIEVPVSDTNNLRKVRREYESKLWQINRELLSTFFIERERDGVRKWLIK